MDGPGRSKRNLSKFTFLSLSQPARRRPTPLATFYRSNVTAGLGESEIVVLPEKLKRIFPNHSDESKRAAFRGRMVKWSLNIRAKANVL